MFRVCEKQAPAGPYRLGVTATLAMLAFATAFGLAVRHQKLAAREIKLGGRVQVGGYPISLLVPVGWRQKPNIVEGEPVVAFDAGNGINDRYQLLLWRANTHGASAQSIGRQLLGAVSDGLIGRPGGQERTSLGPLAAIQISSDQFACCVAIAPNGQYLALTLTTSVPVDGHAGDVLRQIVGTVEWSDPPLATSLESLSSRTGLRFQALSPTVFVPSTDEGIDRIQVLSGAGGRSSWVMNVVQTDLAAGRKTRDLPEDLILNNNWSKARTTTVSIGEDRQAIYCRHVTDESLTEQWAAEVGEAKAVLIRIEIDQSEEKLAAEICRLVAETAAISPSACDIDMTKAIELGEPFVQEVRRQGVSHWWEPQGRQLWYVGSADGQPSVWVSESRQLLEGEAAGHLVKQVYHHRLPNGKLKPVRELTWTIDEQGRSRQGPANAPSACLGPGAKDLAMGLIARRGSPEPAIVFGTLVERPDRWYATFCRALPPALNKNTGIMEYPLVVRDDFSCFPQRLFFDETLRLVREEHEQLEFRLTGEDQAKKEVPSSDRESPGWRAR